MTTSWLQTCSLLVQLTTAIKRLSTTFGEEKGFLGQPEGSFQDLTRFIIAAAYSYSMHKGRTGSVKDTDLVDWQTHQYSEGTMTYALCCCGFAPDVAATGNTEGLLHCCNDLHCHDSSIVCMSLLFLFCFSLATCITTLHWHNKWMLS